MAKKTNNSNKKKVTAKKKPTNSKPVVGKTSVRKIGTKRSTSVKPTTKKTKAKKASKPVLPKKSKGSEIVHDPSASYNKARFDIRFSQNQKDLFEYAASIGGFKTLTAFLIHSAELNAEKILNRYNLTIESERDRAVFFKALTNPAKPNKVLIKAVKEFNKLTNPK